MHLIRLYGKAGFLRNRSEISRLYRELVRITPRGQDLSAARGIIKKALAAEISKATNYRSLNVLLKLVSRHPDDIYKKGLFRLYTLNLVNRGNHKLETFYKMGEFGTKAWKIFHTFLKIRSPDTAIVTLKAKDTRNVITFHYKFGPSLYCLKRRPGSYKVYKSWGASGP